MHPMRDLSPRSAQRFNHHHSPCCLIDDALRRLNLKPFTFPLSLEISVVIVALGHLKHSLFAKTLGEAVSSMKKHFNTHQPSYGCLAFFVLDRDKHSTLNTYCWRTLKESCKGLGSVSLKNKQPTHTHTFSLRLSQWGYWGPPNHNMGPCSRPGEDPNAWKQSGLS